MLTRESLLAGIVANEREAAANPDPREQRAAIRRTDVLWDVIRGLPEGGAVTAGAVALKMAAAGLGPRAGSPRSKPSTVEPS